LTAFPTHLTTNFPESLDHDALRKTALGEIHRNSRREPVALLLSLSACSSDSEIDALGDSGAIWGAFSPLRYAGGALRADFEPSP